MSRPPLPRQPVTQPQDASYRYIPLTQRQVAIVDVDDFEWLSQFNWCALWNGSAHTFYALRAGTTGPIYMHRQVMHCADGEECDHKNLGGLDNRKINLRVCTSSENKRNRPRQSNNTSGFKGVTRRHSGKKMWYAQITHLRRHIFLGAFSSPEEAAMAYDQAAQRLHGRFANLNFKPNTSVAARGEG